MKWQSEKHVASEEAGNWARHFEQLEKEMDELQLKLLTQSKDKIKQWIREGRYVTGREIVAAGLAEMMEL